MDAHQKILPCPICTHAADEKYRQHVGYQEPAVFDIYHCSQCSTAFSHPGEVDHRVYDLIYSKIAEVPGYERYLYYANQVVSNKEPLKYLSQSEDMYWGIAQYLKKRNKTSTKILEVGCGFGYLT